VYDELIIGVRELLTERKFIKEFYFFLLFDFDIFIYVEYPLFISLIFFCKNIRELMSIKIRTISEGFSENLEIKNDRFNILTIIPI